MKAYLIDPEAQRIETIDFNSTDELSGLIGFDTIASDPIGEHGDLLHFDEECFLRGSTGRFQIDTVVPVSGKAILAGSTDGQVSDVKITAAELDQRLKYL